MRLSTHLDPEALATLAALGSPPKDQHDGKRGRNAKLAEQNARLKKPEPTPRTAPSRQEQMISLTQASKVLGLSGHPLQRLLAEQGVKVRNNQISEDTVPKKEIAVLCELRIEADVRVNLADLPQIFDLPAAVIREKCRDLQIITSKMGQPLPDISARNYDRLRVALTKQTHILQSGAEGTAVLRKRQAEGKHLLKQAKENEKTGYAVVVSGGLPTLGRGHR